MPVPVVENGVMKSDDPPPPYPGYSIPSRSEAPPPYPGNNAFNYPTPSAAPVYIDPISTVPAVQPSACPQCGVGGMEERPDVGLIMCLVLMAFLFTPLTLCCIPCAFREQCTNCGYSKI